MDKEKIKVFHCIEGDEVSKEEEACHTFDGHCHCNPKWEQTNKTEFLAGMVNHKIILHKRLLDKENQH